MGVRSTILTKRRVGKRTDLRSLSESATALALFGFGAEAL